MLVSVLAECFLSGRDLSDSPLCLSFLVFPETNELRCAEGKPFPLLALPQFFVTSWFLFCFCFYFHPSALNNVLSCRLFTRPSLGVGTLSRTPPPVAEVYIGTSQVVCTLQCPVKLCLGNYLMNCLGIWNRPGHRWNAETETKHACGRSSTSPHSGCCLLFLKQGTQIKHLFLNSVA